MPTTRPNIRCSSTLARPSISPGEPARQGHGLADAQADRDQQAEGADHRGHAGSATGKRSGIASRDSHQPLPVAAGRGIRHRAVHGRRCAPAIRCTVARRFRWGIRLGDVVRGVLVFHDGPEMIDRSGTRRRRRLCGNACFTFFPRVGPVPASAGSPRRDPPRSRPALPVRAACGPDHEHVLVVRLGSPRPQPAHARELSHVRRPGAA